MDITINATEEWSWIFALSTGQSYGEYLRGNNVKIITHKGAEPFFYFANVIETTPVKKDLKAGCSEIYLKEFDPKKSIPIWNPPPYKDYYKEFLKTNTDEIIVISNKYNIEWGVKPYNYIDLDFLEKFFKKFSSKYKIYYIRYRGMNEEYSDDVAPLDFKDYELTDKYNIETVYDVIDAYNVGFNTAQLYIHSKAKHTISVAGGNAILSAFFGTDLVQYHNITPMSKDRTVWSSESWLSELGCTNIIGANNYNELFKICNERW